MNGHMLDISLTSFPIAISSTSYKGYRCFARAHQEKVGEPTEGLHNIEPSRLQTRASAVIIIAKVIANKSHDQPPHWLHAPTRASGNRCYQVQAPAQAYQGLKTSPHVIIPHR